MKSKIRFAMKAGVIFTLILTFVLPGSAIIKSNYIQTDSSTDLILTLDKAKELSQSENAILLYVQEEADNFIDGAISVSLSELSCSSCFGKLLDRFDLILIYSEDTCGEKAIKILQEQGYNVLLVSNTEDTFDPEMDSNLDEEILSLIDESLREYIPVFLFFYAEWCPFSQMERSVLTDEFKISYSTVTFLEINVETSDLDEEFDVKGLPTMFFITGKNRQGYIYKEFFGFLDEKELTDTLIDTLDKINAFHYGQTTNQDLMKLLCLQNTSSIQFLIFDDIDCPSGLGFQKKWGEAENSCDRCCTIACQGRAEHNRYVTPAGVVACCGPHETSCICSENLNDSYANSTCFKAAFMFCVLQHENVHRGDIDCSQNPSGTVRTWGQANSLPWLDPCRANCSECEAYQVSKQCIENIDCSAVCSNQSQREACEYYKQIEIGFIDQAIDHYCGLCDDCLEQHPYLEPFYQLDYE